MEGRPWLSCDALPPTAYERHNCATYIVLPDSCVLHTVWPVCTLLLCETLLILTAEFLQNTEEINSTVTAVDEGEISLWVTGSSQAQASSLRMASSVLMHKLLCCWSQYAYVGDSLTTWKCVRKSQRQNDRRPMVLSHNHDCKTSDKSQAPENRHTIQLLKEYFAPRTKLTKKKLWAQSVLVMRAVIAQV